MIAMCGEIEPCTSFTRKTSWQTTENNSIMVKNFEKTKALLERVDRQMDRLIDKL